MTIYRDYDIQRFKRQLQEAIIVCSDRCLFNATKWAAEVLDGIKIETLDLSNQFEHQQSHVTDYDASLPPFNEQEYNKYQYAKSLFHMRQFENVSYILHGYDNPRLRFLRLYAKYLAGEKRKEEQTQDILGASDNSLSENTYLNSIYDELYKAYDQKQPLDAFCLYLYGIVLVKRGEMQMAASILLESIKKYECNWSAWLELGKLVLNKKMMTDLQKILEARMPNSIMKDFFMARLAMDTHQPYDYCSSLMGALTDVFPESTYIKAQWAICMYDNQEYYESEILFDDLRRTNPYRLEDMDVFSNLLYLKDSMEKLSVLAHQCERIDKYRPETCCIIANYYSIKREISVSIEYFKRAIKLNRSYHWVWTLLGHDYVEMKNTNAAVECYRRAVDYNQHDYRAWYGLGQAYEVLKLPFYAIFYYQKAADIRPSDARMWNALGGCYQLLQKNAEAADCYQKAVECEHDAKQNSIIQLARIFDKMGRDKAAARYYLQTFEQFVSDGQEADEMAEAALYVARYMLSKDRLDNAEHYASAALPFNFPYHEEAQSILDEIATKRTQ
ncbi:anaphase-promoting complex subunit 8-like protein [Hesseltinella vesiculosa]|uniref:Anaphase-promoting complex subunit 8-like protein n=1 Tax=Hesseltinella vesiculosa TaxID=101127 RepID=A0A1X2GM35_9FUNG|nr:anaphase-promoting complex subunit 8-like protein [Hesseltinella vesiculosa]